MQKIYKHRVRIILGLSVIIVILLGGIFANQLLSFYVSEPAQNTSTFLPTISAEKYYGSEKDDTFLDAFFVDKDVYVFYNNDKGVMQKSGNSEHVTEYEGEIIKVALTSHGFVTAIKTQDSIALQHVDFEGVPFASYTINLVDAQVQYLDYDGEICVAIRSKSDFDYVLTYYKFDDNLKEVYRRDIYSLYNLSTVAIYPLSNKTIIFFSATYGSVKRGGYTILHNVSLSMTTEYYSSVTDYTVTDAKPYKNGYLISVLEKGIPKLLYLDENFGETLIPIIDETRNDLKIHTNAQTCYIQVSKENGVDLYTFDGSDLVLSSNFADKIYDCLFFDNSAIFAIKKSNVVYVLHSNTGILSPILASAPASLKLKFSNRLCFFTSLLSYSGFNIGGLDVYFASLL